MSYEALSQSIEACPIDSMYRIGAVGIRAAVSVRCTCRANVATIRLALLETPRDSLSSIFST